MSAMRRARRRTAMALRCDTVAGRLTSAGADTVHPEGWGFLAEPGATGLLHTLPESCRDRALPSCLMHAINAATPPEPISVHRTLEILQCTLTVCDASCKATRLPRGETCETLPSVRTRA